MGVVRAHTKHLGRVGFVQPLHDPGALAGGGPPASATPTPLGPGGGAGPAAAPRWHLQNKDSGRHLSLPHLPPPLGRRRLGPRRPGSPSGRRGPGSGGPRAIASTGFLPANPAPHPQAPRHILFVMTVDAARAVLSAREGDRRAHVWSRRGRRAGAAGCAVNRCLSAVVVPTHHPPPPPPGSPPTHTPFLSAAQLLWVTRVVAMGYQTEAAGSLPATQPPPAEPPGREAAGARVCGTRRGACARAAGAAANRRPRGSGGSASARGAGATL